MIFCLALFGQIPAHTKNLQADIENPSRLDDYDFVVRGKISRERGIRPQQIAGLDNNGEILIACQEARSIQQLKASGIVFLRSQLELLADWDFLTYNSKDKTYKTTIHIYGVQKSTALRKLVSTSVDRLRSKLSDELESLKNHLASMGSEKSLFAVLYGYILHSYSMEQFGKELYQKSQLPASLLERIQLGCFPLRKFNTGVTSQPVEGAHYIFVSAGTAPRSDFQGNLAFAKNHARDGKINDPALLSTFYAFDVVNDQGELTIPVFTDLWAAKLENMAKTVYAETEGLAEAAEIKNILGMATQARREMFLHYEIRYAFLDLLLQNKFMLSPVDFEDSQKNSAADVGNLIFLIKKAEPVG